MIVVRVLRTVLGIPLIVIGVIVAATLIGIAGDGPFADRVLRAWCRFVLACAGARVIAQAPALDPGKSYVFVSNHTSNMDVPAIVPSAPSSVRFVAKNQLRKIPLFGWGAERMGHVFIDRRDPHGAAKAISARLEKGLGGVGLFFFAEGTRSTTDEMLPFKKGAAVMGIKAGVPIVPVACSGAHKVMRKRSLRIYPGEILVEFLSPIDASAFENRDDLNHCVRRAMAVALPPDQRPIDFATADSSPEEGRSANVS